MPSRNGAPLFCIPVASGGIDEYTAMILHGDVWPLVDSSFSPKSLTVIGSVSTTDTNVPVGFGKAIKVPSNYSEVQMYPSQFPSLLNGDFVIDTRVRFDVANNRCGIFGITHYNSVLNGDQRNLQFYYDFTGNRWVIIHQPAGSIVTTYISDTLVVNTWYHVALVRSSDVFYVLRDGVVKGDPFTSALRATSYHANNNYIGADISLYATKGLLDEFRISVGTDRGWTSGFTPSTVPYF